MNLTNTYKNYTISYNGRSFSIYLEDKLQTNRPKDIESCISWIDKQLKETFIRTKVLVTSWNNDIKKAKATSLVENRAWVIYENGQREMVDVAQLLTLSQTNLDKIAQCQELHKQAALLTQEANTIKSSLEAFDTTSMLVNK
jgi:urease accessory protein UreF